MSYKLYQVWIIAVTLSFQIISGKAIADFTEHYEDALQSFAEENIDVAYIHLQNALQEKPDHLPSKILMGKVLFERGLLQDALTEFEEASQAGADKNNFVVWMARIYLRRGDNQKVLSLPLNNLNEDNLAQINILRGKAFSRERKSSEAEAEFLLALNIYPEDIEALNLLAAFYVKEDRIKDAVPIVEQALRFEPDNPFSIELKGRILKAQRDIEASLLYFERAFQLESEDPVISRNYANALILKQDYQKALSIINAVLLEDPDEPYAMLLKARLLDLRGEKKLAESVLRDISQRLSVIPASIKSTRPQLYYLGGVAAYLQEDYQSAFSELNSFILFQKNDFEAIKLLLDVQIKLKETNWSMKLMEQNMQAVKENVTLTLVLCELYINANRSYKCDQLLEVLAPETKQESEQIDLMRIKTILATGNTEKAYNLFIQLFASTDNLQAQEVGVRLLMAQNQFESALTKLDTMILSYPNTIDYQLLKTESLIKLNQYAAAQNTLDEILRQSTDSFDARYQQLYIMTVQQNWSDARSLSKDLLKEKRAHLGVNMLYVDALIAEEEYDEAAEILRFMRDLLPANLEPKERLFELYLSQNDLEEALYAIDSLVKQEIMNPKYLLQKADIHILRNEPELAAKEYQKLFGLWSESPQKLLVLAQRQREIKDYEACERTLSQGLKLDPKFHFLNLEKAKMFIEIGQLVNAVAILDGELKDRHSDANVLALRGDVALARNRIKDAYSYHMKALQANNNFVPSAIKLFQISLANDIDSSKFRTLMSNIVEQYPEAVVHRNLLADLHLQLEQYDDAEKHYLILSELENYSNVSSVKNNLAVIYIESDLDKALKNAEKANSLSPNRPTFLDTLGWILTLKGEYTQGLRYLREATALDNSNLENQFHIAFTLHKLGRDAEAQQILRVLNKIKRPFKSKSEAIKLYEKLRAV